MTHPDYRDIEDEMLAWAEGQWREKSAGDPNATQFTAWAYESDVTRQDLLRRRGYAQTDAYFSFRTRRLDEPIPEPVLPPGYTIRAAFYIVWR